MSPRDKKLDQVLFSLVQPINSNRKKNTMWISWLDTNIKKVSDLHKADIFWSYPELQGDFGLKEDVLAIFANQELHKDFGVCS